MGKPHRQDTAVLPPPERGQHDPVEKITAVVTDESGRTHRTRPYQIVGLLDRLKRQGSINSDMWKAGEKFRDSFRIAELDPLRAGDLSRPMVDGRSGRHATIGGRQMDARDIVYQAIIALGGMSSPAGSCVWHVLGLEESLRSWVETQRGNITRDQATGVLIASLGVLEQHFAKEN